MEDREQVIFKTKLFGFEKKAVLAHIDQLYAESKRRQQQLSQMEEDHAALSAQSVDLRQENERLNTENEELRQQNEQLRAQAVQMKKDQEEIDAGKQAEALAQRERDGELLRKQVTCLNEEILNLKKQLAQKEDTIRKLSAESDMLINQQSELSEKGMKYDQISNSVGVVVLEAQRTADTIIASANSEAAQVRRAATDSVSQIGEHLEQFLEEIGKIQLAAARTMENFQSGIARMEETVHSAQVFLQGQGDEQHGVFSAPEDVCQEQEQ